MTTTDEQSTAAHAAADAGADAAAATAAAAANPALVGVPTFVVGSVCLGLYLVGFTGASSTVAIALVPILILANGLGLLLATVWAIRLGQGPVASIFGIFAGFWLSFPLLVLGLAHGWFGDATEAAVATNAQVAFLLTWLIGVIVLTVATLRLPSVFTVLFVLIDIALLLVMLGTAQGSTGLLFVGGIAVFAFALVGVYLFIDAMGQATGGKPMPMGKPIIG